MGYLKGSGVGREGVEEEEREEERGREEEGEGDNFLFRDARSTFPEGNSPPLVGCDDCHDDIVSLISKGDPIC